MEKDITNLLNSIPKEIISLFNKDSTYLVGGAVRDYLLNRPFFDFDFIVSKEDFHLLPSKLEKQALKYIVLNREALPLYRVFLEDFTFDFTPFEDLESDIYKRDFTINAIYVNLGNSKLYYHPFSLEDLDGKVLRVCSHDSIKIDPVRFMRAFRFLAQYQLKIEDNTRAVVLNSKDLYFLSKRERARLELLKFLKNNIEEIKESVLQIFDNFDFSFAARVYIAQKLPELRKNFNRDSTFLDILKAYFLGKSYSQFIYGLTEKELELLEFMNLKVANDFESLFNVFYIKRSKPEFLLLNIVANFNEDLVEKFAKIIITWKKEKVKFDIVDAYARKNLVSIDVAYREVLKERFLRIYENICNN